MCTKNSFIPLSRLASPATLSHTPTLPSPIGGGRVGVWERVREGADKSTILTL
jgi:hypothetical protein